MQATLSRVSPTPTQAPALRVGRNPAVIAREISVIQPQAEEACRQFNVSSAALSAVKRLDELNEELIAAVIRERPALGARAQYKARLAETAHDAYMEGALSLDTRNHLASSAAELRMAILEHAQAYLDAAGAGYLSNRAVRELHHVAV